MVGGGGSSRSLHSVTSTVTQPVQEAQNVTIITKHLLIFKLYINTLHQLLDIISPSLQRGGENKDCFPACSVRLYCQKEILGDFFFQCLNKNIVEHVALM